VKVRYPTYLEKLKQSLKIRKDENNLIKRIKNKPIKGDSVRNSRKREKNYFEKQVY
jgi:hypothetical protein